MRAVAPMARRDERLPLTDDEADLLGAMALAGSLARTPLTGILTSLTVGISLATMKPELAAAFLLRVMGDAPDDVQVMFKDLVERWVSIWEGSNALDPTH